MNPELPACNALASKDVSALSILSSGASSDVRIEAVSID